MVAAGALLCITCRPPISGANGVWLGPLGVPGAETQMMRVSHFLWNGLQNKEKMLDPISRMWTRVMPRGRHLYLLGSATRLTTHDTTGCTYWLGVQDRFYPMSKIRSKRLSREHDDQSVAGAASGIPLEVGMTEPPNASGPVPLACTACSHDRTTEPSSLLPAPPADAHQP